ncbi:TraR/DksA C4-type zinc finger protein [Photorhabdus sp. RM71S]|uniref:TraR/DksA C4-type zinc finger protein n=1 Tax=Photorhabdus sp. RM71S TaxID=3342824 RepID=UPI0036D9B4B6
MSDSVDIAEKHIAATLERQIRAVTDRCTSVSAFECDDCGNSISEERRKAVIGVTRCITCQSIIELKQKHYRSV